MTTFHDALTDEKNKALIDINRECVFTSESYMNEYFFQYFRIF